MCLEPIGYPKKSQNNFSPHQCQLRPSFPPMELGSNEKATFLHARRSRMLQLRGILLQLLLIHGPFRTRPPGPADGRPAAGWTDGHG